MPIIQGIARLKNHIKKMEVIIATILVLTTPNTKSAIELRMPKSAKAIVGIKVMMT